MHFLGQLKGRGTLFYSGKILLASEFCHSTMIEVDLIPVDINLAPPNEANGTVK